MLFAHAKNKGSSISAGCMVTGNAVKLVRTFVSAPWTIFL